MASLQLVKDKQPGSSISLSIDGGKTEWSVGRSLDCDINLPHASVSRRHARVFYDGSGYYVEDLGSTHGTFVAGARLTEPARLFDGLRVAFGTSPFELVPCDMMAAMMAAMRAQQAEQAAAAKRKQEEQEAAEAEADEPAPASDAHRLGAALLEHGETGVAATRAAAEAEAAKAADEDDAMRGFDLPMHFGKAQQKGGPSLEAQHAANAREAFGDTAAPSLKGKKKGGAGPTIKMAANLGASIGAGAGLAVPAATPTLAALQKRRAEEKANAPAASTAPPPPKAKQIGANAPMRPPVGANDDDDDDEEVGPALPPGFGAGGGGGDGGDEDEDEVGPMLPPGFGGGGGAAAAAAARRCPLRRRVRQALLVDTIQTT